MQSENGNNTLVLRKYPWMTWLLISLSIFVYVMMAEEARVTGSLMLTDWIRFGAAHPIQIWSGEVWRLATAMFLHGNLLHLLLNCFVLFQIGRLFEPIVGQSRFLLIYLFSGIVGFSLSLVFNASLSVGSSGAVFGLVGALIGTLVLMPSKLADQRLLRALLFFVSVNISLGLLLNFGVESSFGIDNAAHLGGGLAGFLLGCAFIFDVFKDHVLLESFGLKKKILSHMSLVVAFLLLFGSVGFAIRPMYSANHSYQMAVYHLGQKELSLAEQYAESLKNIDPNSPWNEVLKGKLSLFRGEKTIARESFKKAMNEFESLEAFWAFNFKNRHQGAEYSELLFRDEASNQLICKVILEDKRQHPTSEMLNDCAWLMLMSKSKEPSDTKLALSWVKLAAQVKEGISPEVLHTLAEAYRQNGKVEEAKITIERGILQYPKYSSFFKEERNKLQKRR